MIADPIPVWKDYQKADFGAFLGRYLRGDTMCVCEWKPGLGKSLLAIMLARTMQFRRMLITGPSIALVSWRQQLDTWWPSARYLIIKAGTDIKKLTPDIQVVVVTHDLQRNDDVRTALRDWAQGAFVVIDEAQYLRGHATKRTGAAYGRGEGSMSNAACGLILSGSLIVSWPDDLWTHLARWMPERIILNGQRMDYETFRDHFMVTRQVPITGTHMRRTQICGMRPEMLADLRARLDGWSIRREKSEAGLPPLTWKTLELELTPADRKRIDTELNDNLPVRLQTLAAAAARAPDDMEIAQRLMDAFSDYTDLWAVAMRVLGVGKAHALSRVLKEKLDNSPASEAIGIFSINHTVMDVFDTTLKGYGTLRVDGGTSLAKREKAVEQFMDPNGPRVFNGQIEACGTALTLVRGDTCYFPQLSPTPGTNEQAASRFHRIGQRNPVDAVIPYVKGTLDQPLMGLLRKKNQTAASVQS